jgi:hypothetical protein
MRLRAGILGVVLLFALTACGGGDDEADKKPTGGSTRLGTPSDDVTESVLDCAKYADTAQEIVEAQQELFAGSGGSTEALDALKSQMNALKDGAPDNVQAAIDELNEAFEKVQEIIHDPSASAEAQRELQEMGSKLATDGQTITTYIVSQCKK